MNILFKEKNRGFTLVELMVSIAIFSLVSVVAVGSIIVINNSNKQIINRAIGVNNIDFAMESIARTVKTGTNPRVVGGELYVDNWILGLDMSRPSNFVPRNKVTYIFRKNGSFIERKVGTGDYVPITSPEFEVTAFGFNVIAGLPQPAVRLNISGKVVGLVDLEFNAQTTVSQQDL